MNYKISTFEIFPNELLLETFEYMSSFDLFHIFYHLNFRFFLLINSLKCKYLTFEEDWDTKLSEIPFFASYITTLIIKHDEFVDFSFFPNIRSLRLCRPTPQQCHAILPHLLPKLEHLSISNLYYSNTTEQLSRLIFSSSFPFLKLCQIDRITSIHFNSSSSLSLNQLIISPCTWTTNMFNQIFRASPNLQYLRLINHRNISFDFTSYSIPPHISIRRLLLYFDKITEQSFNEIKYILSVIPNLETLAIIIDQADININFLFFSSFAGILNQHTPRIINFKAKIPFNNLSSASFNKIPYLHQLFVYVKVKENRNENSEQHLFILSSN